MSGSRGKLLRVGLYALITLGASVLIYFQVAKVSFGDKYTLRAQFDDVTGLFKDDDVKLAGVPVGKVTGIKVVKGRAEVKFSVKKSVKLPADSTAVVRWRNPLGQRYVYVVPGSAKRLLGNGDLIRETTAVVDLGDFINKLSRLTGAVTPEKLNAVFSAIDDAFSGNEDNFDTLISELNTLLGALAPRDRTISGLVEDYSSIAEVVGRRDQQIKTAIDDLVAISHAFAGNTEMLDRALVELSELTTNLGIAIGGKADELARIVDNLAVITGLTEKHIGELENTFANFPDAAKAIFSLVDQGELARANILCAQGTPPPCLHPIIVGAPNAPKAALESTRPVRSPVKVVRRGAGRLSSSSSFAALLLGAGA